MWIRLIKNKVLFFIIFIIPLILAMFYFLLFELLDPSGEFQGLNALVLYGCLVVAEIVIYSAVLCTWALVSDFIKGDRKDKKLIIILLILFTLRAIAGYIRAR